MSDGVKLDERFRTGIKTAALPYERAARVHRDAMLSPAPDVKLRLSDRGAAFASAHRRLITVVSAVAALTGVAAYAVPSMQSASRAKINPNPTATTNAVTNGSTVPGRGPKPGNGNGNGPTGNDNAPGGVLVGVNNPPYGSPGGGTQTGSGGSTDTGNGSTGGTTPPTVPTGPVLDVTTPPSFSSANHMLLVVDDSGFHQPRPSVGEGVAQIGLQDGRSNPVGIASVAVDGVIIKAGSLATLHMDDVDFPYIATAAVDDRQVGGSLNIYADVAPLAQGHDDQYVLSVTLSHDGFSLDTRGSRLGDEPYWTRDPDGAPKTPDRLWTTIVLPPQQVPRVHITVNDHLPHTFSVLTLAGTNKHFRAGDLSAKATSKVFSLPTQAKGAPYRKFVLQYDEPDGDVHMLVIWVIGK